MEGRPLAEPIRAALPRFRRASLAPPRLASPRSPRLDSRRPARTPLASPRRAAPVGCPGFGLDMFSN